MHERCNETQTHHPNQRHGHDEELLLQDDAHRDGDVHQKDTDPICRTAKHA
eukprot:gene5798-biopygen13352